MTDELRDYAGGIIIGCVLREQPQMSAIAVAGADAIENLDRQRTQVRTEVIELWQGSDPWEEVIERAFHFASNAGFLIVEKQLLVDVTEASSDVIETIQDIDAEDVDAHAMVLTQERSEGYQDGCYCVPRRDVVGALLQIYRAGAIRVSAELELAEALETSLSSVTIKDSDQIEALPLAVGIVCWRAKKDDPGVAMKDEQIIGYDALNWGTRRQSVGRRPRR